MNRTLLLTPAVRRAPLLIIKQLRRQIDTVSAMLDRRRDHTTSIIIAEALRMKTAFGDFAAHTFLRRQNVPLVTAVRAIAGRYDPRQRPG